MGKVVHFEIPADDLERAKKFYSDVFGWSVNDLPDLNYVLVGTVDVDENQMPKESGAINGGMKKRDSETPHPVITIDVENIDRAIEKIEQKGGKQIGNKQEVPGMGYTAYFKDTEGNITGLWQNIK